MAEDRAQRAAADSYIIEGIRSLMTRSTHLAAPLLIFASIAMPTAKAAKSPDVDLERQFDQTVRPFLATYCMGCHSGEKAVANFDLQSYSTMESVVRGHAYWTLVLGKLSAKQMPPPETDQPTEDARRQVIGWIEAVRKNEASKKAGDPGEVLARRLSNAEYDYTIRDLTGVDLRPTREFPVDPANQAGFDNSGESLTMSPSLMAKYLQAARSVAI